MMEKVKNYFNKLHQRRPYLEPLVLSVTTASLGFIINMYTCFLNDNPRLWFWQSGYFWIALALLLIIVLYYIFLSTYTNTYKEYTGCIIASKKSLLEGYMQTTKIQSSAGNLEAFEASTTMFQKSNMVIDEVYKGQK